MESLHNLSAIQFEIEKISQTSSRLDKERSLRGLFGQSDLAKKVFLFAYDPFKHYNIQKLPYRPGKGFFKKSIEECTDPIFDKLEELASREGANKEDIEYLAELSSCDTKTFELVKNILNKDLRCGVNSKTLRKMLPELPYHDVMLCDKDIDKFIEACGGSWDNVVYSLKLDGVRCWATITLTKEGYKVEYISRNGKKYSNFHIFDAWLCARAREIHLDNMLLHEPIIFDGEVVSDGDFQKTSTQLQRKDGVDTSKFKFAIFDCPSWDMSPLDDRLAFLEKYFYRWDNTEYQGGYVPHFDVGSEEECNRILAEYLEAGEEGLVLKNINSQYEKKRSRQWCKLKASHTEDLMVVGKLEGEGKFKGTLGALQVDFKGVIVKVGSGFSDDERKEFWDTPPRMIEVKFQQETNDGSLRFPVFVRVREDK